MHDEHDSDEGAAGDGWLDRVNEAYYDRLGEGMGRKTRDRINWMCAQCAGTTVLDVGCSQGITSILLAREGFDCHGIDIMSEAVDYALRELAAESPEVRGRVEFSRMDLLSMSPDKTYDNVVMGEVVEHQTSASRFLRAARRHVAPGGRLVVTVPFGLHPFPDHKCTVFPRDIAEALDGMRLDHLDVVDGYIRVVASDAEAAVGSIGLAHLLETTESGTLEAQELRFQALASARRHQESRKAVAEKLAQANEKARAYAKESEKALSRERNELAQLKSQLLLVRNEALTASAEVDKLRPALDKASIELKDARSAQEAARRQQVALEQSVTRAATQRIALDRDLAEAVSQRESALQELGRLESQVQDGVSQLEQAQRRVRHLRAESRRREREREADKQRYELRIERMADYRRRLEHQHATLKGWLEEANSELAFVKGSVSFQLGLTLIAATRSLRDFIALPVRLGRLFAHGMRRRRDRRNQPAPAAPAGAKEEDPSLAFGSAPDRQTPGKRATTQSPRAPTLNVSRVAPVSLASKRTRVLPPPDSEPEPAVVGELPSRVSDMRVAAIMDDFTRESFRHCCHLRQLSPGGWREELQSFAPHLVLVESAWKGEGEAWARKIYPLSEELRALVAWARQAGIPTAFWNKEDPVHFSVFLATARLFDHVFTTDIDCIKSYRAELGHDRVHLLPFACEPRTHNPIQTRPREEGFCFAGSYYVKYPERQRDFASIVDALRTIGTVDIFDRNLGKAEESLQFPAKYADLIRGNLPYAEIDRAYKGYRYGININTVKQSQSMFARRAYDLLASNTVTVSNYSRGMRLMFGELVISSDNGGEVMKRVSPFLHDDSAYRKFRLRGLRKVLSEHTYEDRMAFVASKVSGRRIEGFLPAVSVLGMAGTADELAALLASYDRQDYPRKNLLLLLGSDVDAGPASARADVTVLPAAAATARIGEATGADFAAVFSHGDYYGPAYLTDLALATRYCDAALIGKVAHYSMGPTGAITLSDDGTQYEPCTGIPAERCIVRVADIAGRRLAEVVQGACTGGLPGLAVDEFNYCRGCAASRCEDVDDLVLDTGIGIARLQAMADAEDEGPGAIATEAALVGFGPTELSALFGDGDYAEGRIRLSGGDKGIEVASSLAAGRFAYVYANASVPVEVLFPSEIGRFNMLVSAEMLLSFALIFLDGNQQRIGHVIRACNSNQSVVPPDGTRYVMMGFRIQDAGLAVLDRLVLQHLPPEVDAIVGTGRRLLVSRSYPSYDQLYSYTFVHRRVARYRELGLDVDVFRFSDSPLSYSEFEGVDVVSGNVGDLSLMLRSNQYESVLIHSFDEQVWSAVEPWAGRIRVLVWVHGAEIQPWFRRDFNNGNDAERRSAIHRSDMRLGLWKRVLGDMPENMHLVFVSTHLAREAMRDLGIALPAGRYSVIHNHVDGEFFAWQPKEVAQRHRILSIRPYSKRTYANDLAVKAVLDLSHEPWFDRLQFSFYGDGPLFDETLAPLRGLPNVRIERRFLSQAEIRNLHREHGVFLVPSRIDSQGVSRDEAMASGLVPVTNRVSAIPEFVNEEVAFLAGPEDWRGLADAIRTLHSEPDRFAAMSSAAARHVRSVSGRGATLGREVGLICEGIDTEPVDAHESRARRLAVYGDLNLNLLDGSAIWASSLVEVLAGLPDVEVDLFLKAKLSNTRVVAPLFALDNVRLIEPGATGEVPDYAPGEAVARIVTEDARRGYDAVVLRGFELCRDAAREQRLAGRLWTYMTDIPQDDAALDSVWRADLESIAESARYLLCQTGPLQELLERTVPAARGKTRRLPPMIPDRAEGAVRRDEQPSGRALRIVYAGKFAPLWGIREMLDVAERLRADDVDFELHVYGDKIHNPADDPGFKREITSRLQQTPGVVWHGGVTRAELYEALATMHVGWAWRRPELENSTLELSTKLLEYGQAGLPAVMLPSIPNLQAFGEDYPLFARDVPAIVAILARMAAGGGVREEACARSARVAESHGFDRVRQDWVAPLLDPVPGWAPPTPA